MKPWVLAIGAALFVTLCSTVADAEKADEAKKAEARAKFASGSRAYNLRDYDTALTDFRAVYVIIGDPSLLFNIAQCERQLQRYDEAKKSFQAYLREAQPPPQRVEEVNRLIAMVDQSIEEERARQKAATPEPSTATQPPLVAEPAVSVSTQPQPTVAATTTSHKKRPWVWGIVGAGAVLVVGISVGLGIGLTRGDRYPTPSEGRINGN